MHATVTSKLFIKEGNLHRRAAAGCEVKGDWAKQKG